MSPRLLSIDVAQDCRVSSLFLQPERARACYVFAHGAGVGMEHPSMSSVAGDLAERGIATLRYQFPYMERGSKRPDAPGLCHATVRAATARAAELAPRLPLIAGGRSFGGRMTSQAQAANPLPGVKGLVFLAFPLHPAKRPSVERAQHLSCVRVPMLFVQGARDPLAEPRLLDSVIEGLGERATLKWLEEADHSFHVRARAERTQSDVRAEAMNAILAWTEGLVREA